MTTTSRNIRQLTVAATALTFVLVLTWASPITNASGMRPTICLGANNPVALGNNVYTETANSGACYPNYDYQGKYKSVSGAEVWVIYNNINSSTTDYTTAPTRSLSYVLANPFYDDIPADAPVQLCQSLSGIPLCQSPYSNYGF